MPAAGQLDLVHWETVRTGSSGHASARHVVSGGRFRPLDGPDISKEIEALDDEDGELTGACLRDWLKSYHDESTMFTSLAVYIEIKMREVRHATRNVPMPNAFRTAVCCDMMRKLATCMGGFRDAFEMISLEIYRSIYRDYQPGTFDVFQGTPFYVETRHMKKVADDKQNEIARLQNEIEIRKVRAETAVANLDKIVNKWSSSILVSSFRQWRMYVGGRKDKFKRLSVRHCGPHMPPWFLIARARVPRRNTSASRTCRKNWYMHIAGQGGAGRAACLSDCGPRCSSCGGRRSRRRAWA